MCALQQAQALQGTACELTCRTGRSRNAQRVRVNESSFLPQRLGLGRGSRSPAAPARWRGSHCGVRGPPVEVPSVSRSC